MQATFGTAMSEKVSNPDSPLHSAAGSGGVDEVSTLTTPDSAITPLHSAAGSGGVDEVSTLTTPDSAITPLHGAARSGDVDEVSTLTTPDSAITPLHSAAGSDDVGEVSTQVTPENSDSSTAGSSDESYDCSSEEDVYYESSDEDFVNDDSTILGSPFASAAGSVTPLHHAARSGDVSKVRELLEHGEHDVNSTDLIGRTPLHCACSSGHVGIVRLLVSTFKADVTVQDDLGSTALLLAAGAGHEDVVRALVCDCHISLEHQNKSGQSVLHCACRSGNVHLVRFLIEDCEVNNLAQDNRQRIPLSIAASWGKAEVVLFLIDKFGRPHVSDYLGRSLLHNACEGGDVGLVQTLIEKYHANVRVLDNENNTILHVAALCGRANVVLFLISKSIIDLNVRGHHGRSVLHSACQGGNIALIQTLIHTYQADVNAQDNKGKMPINVAVLSGKVEAALCLVDEFGCDPSVRSHNCRSLLHDACEGGNLGLVKILIQRQNFDVYAQDNQGNTPLNVAALCGNQIIVLSLINEFGCDPNMIGHNGRSLLHDACEGGNLNLVKSLMELYKLDVNAQDDHGSTPLNVAVLCGNKKMSFCLINEFSCDPTMIGHNGRSLLHDACEGGNLSLVKELILEHNLSVNARDHLNNTPLLTAASSGEEKVALTLINEFGDDPSVSNSSGRTVLHCACQTGCLNLVKGLIQHLDVDVNAKDADGNTPLDIVLSGPCGDGDISIVMRLVGDTEFTSDPILAKLHSAALNGEEKVVFLIEKLNCKTKVNSESNDGTGRSLLHCACLGGNVSLVLTLIRRYQADLHCKESNGRTPFHLAVLSHREKVAIALIKNFSYVLRINEKDKNGRHALHEVCENGSENLVRTLVNQCNDNTRNNLRFNLIAGVHMRDGQGNTPLHIALLHGRGIMALLLINELGCNKDEKGHEGRSLLHSACLGSSPGLVAKVSEFVSPLETDDNGDTPLHVALLHGREGAALALISIFECNKDEKGHGGRSLLHSACIGGNPKLVARVSKCVSPLETDDNGDTFLHRALLHGDEIVALPFINGLGCNKDEKGHGGRSLLHSACLGRNPKLVAKVSEFVSPLETDDNGDTPLHVALLHGREEAALSLISIFGCNKDEKGHEGRSLLHSACLGRNPGLVAKVSEFVSPLETDDNGDTPLHVALLHGREEAALALISIFGCNKDEKGHGGRSLLHSARIGGNPKLVARVSKCVSPLETDDNGDTFLHRALLHGDEIVALPFINGLGCNKDEKGHGGRSLLHSACLGRNPKLVAKVSEFVSPLETDDNGDTPLHVALLHGREEAALSLISIFGCNKDEKGHEGRSLLHSACLGSNPGLVAKVSEFVSPLETDDNGDTPLHVALLHGREEAALSLISIFGCNKDEKGHERRSLLHSACLGSNPGLVAKVSEFVSPLETDDNGDTPLHVALLHGREGAALSLISIFGCNRDEKGHRGRSLLHSACIGGNPKLVARVSEYVSPLETDINGDTFLHWALLHGDEIVTLPFINGLGCNKDEKGHGGRSLLHSACIGGNSKLVARVSEYVSPLETDDNGNTPLHVALLHSQEGAALSLISKFGCKNDIKGQGGRSLLHSACIGGNAKLVARVSEVLSPLVTDHNGDTPLHSCAALGHWECINALLDVEAPVLLRNSSGKTPSDLAIGAAKLVLATYMKSNKDNLYAFYDVIKRQAKKKYTKPERGTRIFVIGNAGVGKSSFVEAFKKEGFFDGYWRVSESSVPPHTAGIVPSIHTSKHLGRVLFFDFAGDPEYYSSHAAILENIASSSTGDNIFIIMFDLREDSTSKQLYYWLSFVQYQNFTSKKPFLFTIGSHSDMVSEAEISRQATSIMEVCTCIQPGVENKFFMLDCCQPKSRQINKLKEEIAHLIKYSPRYELSVEASILLGLLEKDFSQVTACPLQTITSHILATGIRLPTDPESLTSLLLELHDIGLLFLVGKAESGNLQVVLNISLLTNKVHQSLFSKHALEGLRVKYQNEGNTSFFNIGIIPELLLPEILPDYITKECLIHLQYCQEISHGDIVAFPSLSQAESFGQSFLFFPALCKEEKGDISLVTPVEDRFSIGWLARCTDPHDYFPPRFLHVLLLRLVFRFTLSAPNLDKVPGVSFDHSYYQRGCTMWKTGVHWLMEEGVECMVELIDDNRDVVIATNSIKSRAENCTSVFIRIISCVMEAKAEFCRPFKPHFFLLDCADLKSSLIPDNLYDMEDVERVLSSAEGIEVILSISRRSQMDVSKLLCMHKLAHWYSLFPIDFTSVLQYLRDIVKELYELGQHLDISPGILDAIDADFPTDTSKRRKELVRVWLNSFKPPGPPCWWQLVEALKKTPMRVLAEEIRNTYCKSL